MKQSNHEKKSIDQRNQRVHTQFNALRDIHIHKNQQPFVLVIGVVLMIIIVAIIIVGPILKIVPLFAFSSKTVGQTTAISNKNHNGNTTQVEPTSQQTISGNSNSDRSMKAAFSGFISGSLVVSSFWACANSNEVYLTSVDGRINGVQYSFTITISNYTGPKTYRQQINQISAFTPSFTLRTTPQGEEWWSEKQLLSVTVNNDQKSGTFTALMVKLNTNNSDKINVQGNWVCNDL